MSSKVGNRQAGVGNQQAQVAEARQSVIDAVESLQRLPAEGSLAAALDEALAALRSGANRLGAVEAELVEAGAPQPGIDRPVPEAGRRASSEELTRIRELALDPGIERTLEAVRELLGMEVAYTSEFADGKQVIRVQKGAAETFGIAEGAAIPLEETLCQRVLAGRLPSVIPDVQGEDRARSLEVVQATGLGAFASVPLTFSDGSLYGTMCAASRDPKPNLGYAELQFLHVFARLVADQLEREALRAKSRELEAQAASAAALIAAVSSRDRYTAEHSRAVVDYAVAVAGRLDLREAEITDVRYVALLHDIGKIAIPSSILSKQGKLTEEEWEILRRHPIESEAIISQVPELRHLGPAVRAEHERWDGEGYPDGLSGEEIPLASRITLVCDAYHAMRSDRPYRPAMSEREARRELIEGMGSQFCPRSTRALLELLERGGEAGVLTGAEPVPLG